MLLFLKRKLFINRPLFIFFFVSFFYETRYYKSHQLTVYFQINDLRFIVIFVEPANYIGPRIVYNICAEKKKEGKDFS